MSRAASAETLRTAGRPARVAAAALSAAPPAAAVALAGLDTAYAVRLVEGLASAPVIAALLLALVGGLLALLLARPPFSLRPGHRRAMRASRRLEDALDRAAVYTAAGLDLERALALVAPADRNPAAATLAETLASPPGAGGGQGPATPVRRIAGALHRSLAEGATPTQALRSTASRVRLERQWAAPQGPLRWLALLAVPLLAGTVPAVVLLALL